MASLHDRDRVDFFFRFLSWNVGVGVRDGKGDRRDIGMDPYWVSDEHSFQLHKKHLLSLMYLWLEIVAHACEQCTFILNVNVIVMMSCCCWRRNSRVFYGSHHGDLQGWIIV